MKAWFEKFEKFNVLVELMKNVWPVIRMISIISGAMMLTFVVVNTGKKDEMGLYIAQYNEYKSEAEKANAMVDELRVQVAEKEQAAKSAMTRASQLNTQVRNQKATAVNAITIKDSLLGTITDSTELARVIIPKQEEIITTQHAIIENQDKEIKELYSVINLKDESIHLLTFSVDSLQQVIVNIPPPPKNPNKFLGIPLPTRKQSFIGGAVVGAVAAFMVLK